MAQYLQAPVRWPKGHIVGQAEQVLQCAYDASVEGGSYEIIHEDDSYAQLAADDTIQVDSSDAADIGMIATIVGIDTNGDRLSEQITTNGTTAVDSANTWRYVENFWIDSECAGTLTLQRKTGPAAIQAIPTGYLKAQTIQIFTGEGRFYLQGVDARLQAVTARDDIDFEVRWYPNVLACRAAANYSYHRLGHLTVQYDATATQAMVSPVDVWRPPTPIQLPPRGWLAVFGKHATDNGDAIVNLYGFHVMP